MRRPWTVDEVNYLLENVGMVKIPTIAQSLRRSENSVILKMNRIGISRTRSQAGFLTVGELSNLLHIERKVACNWVNNYGLKCTIRITRISKKFWFIEPIEFWKWAAQNKHLIDFSKITPHSIPPEPEWVEQERKDLVPKESNYKRWTVKEEHKLLNLVASGYSYTEIAEKLKRTNSSVEKKYLRIKANSRYAVYKKD